MPEIGEAPNQLRRLDSVFNTMFPINNYASMSDLLRKKGDFFRDRNQSNPRVAIDAKDDKTLLNGVDQIQVFEIDNAKQNPYNQPRLEIALIADGKTLEDPFKTTHTMLENLSQYGVFIAHNMPFHTMFQKEDDYNKFINGLKKLGMTVTQNPNTDCDSIFFEDYFRPRRELFEQFQKTDDLNEKSVHYKSLNPTI